jgi:imidazolonepropionase
LVGKALLIRGARQLVTLRGPSGPRRGASLRELSIVEDGSVLVLDGVIAEVGPTRRVENLARARGAELLDAAGRVVMPGLVDCYAHLVSGPPRLSDWEARLASPPERELGVWERAVAAGVAAVRDTPSGRLEYQARRVVAAMVRHGTTTVESRSGYGLDETGEVKSLRVASRLDGGPVDVVRTFFGARTVPGEYSGRSEEYLAWIEGELLPKTRRRGLAEFVDVACGERAFGYEAARGYLDRARALGFRLRVRGSAALAVETGAISVSGVEAPLAFDAERLARSATIAVLTPGAAFYSGSRRSPARTLIEYGAAVAVATGHDSVLCPTVSLPAVLSIACTELRMTPGEALSSATINAAHALGRAQRCGSLECNKYADIVLLNAGDYRELPFRFGSNLVHMTIKRGEIIYREGDVVWGEG